MTAADQPSTDAADSARAPVSITVFFPCHNEQDNVAKVVRQAVEVLDGIGTDAQIIVVDDGSADQTGRIAEQMAAQDARIKVVRHETNLGYGAALRSGFAAAAKPLVFYTDGDGQFDLHDLPPLLPLIERFDIVACYRQNRRDRLFRRTSGWLWTQLVCALFGLRLRDIDCAFKLYRREIFDNITLLSTGALIDAEILARAARKGYTMTQAPVRHYPRTAGAQSGASLKVVLRAFKELILLWRKIRRAD